MISFQIVDSSGQEIGEMTKHLVGGCALISRGKVSFDVPSDLDVTLKVGLIGAAILVRKTDDESVA